MTLVSSPTPAVVSRRGGVFLLALLLFAALVAGAAENRYVGSARCGECHSDRYQELTNSIHQKMIRVNGHLPGVTHGDLRQPNAPTTNEYHWVMGGWYKEESYIRTNYVNNQWVYQVTMYQWDPIKGNYVSNQLWRDWLVKCAGCHTTGYNPTTRTFNELNIGCEHCHGPGGNHADSEDPGLIVIDRSNAGCGHCHIRAENAATSEFPARTFNFPIGYVAGQPETLQFIPEPLTAASSFFPDGTSRRHRQQYLDVHYPGVRVTKHHAEGVSCVKCHNPHTAGTVTTYENALPPNTPGIKIYDNVNNRTNYVAWDGARLWHPTSHLNISSQGICKACHTDVSDHHVHQFNAAASAASVTCVDCHMPDVINVDPKNLRGALRPHTFNAMLPATSIKYGASLQPNSCTYRCHQGSGTNAVTRAAWADSIISLKLAPVVAATHPYQLRLVGTPDYQYALEASTDLREWVTLGTNTAAPLLEFAPRWGFQFTDPNSASSNYRFFRARQVYPAP